MNPDITPAELRQQIRRGDHTGNTSGLCAGFVQCNMVILPKDWAAEFLQFSQLNPKPCPVLGMSAPGSWEIPELAANLDVRSDLPSYKLFENGEFIQEVTDIKEHWRDDLVTFMLGCSFSFEEALLADGLEVRNISEGCNVPMYRTNIPCRTAGRFSGTMVVSMRPFLAADAIRAVQICTRFPSVHGAPVHLGDPSLIGIDDISKTDFGDPVTLHENEIPVFWACGVTPQVALEQAKPPFCITHSPGCMLVTDVPNSKLAIL
ncbi:putative hydro-lyase [Leucothrix pacifica]|uniref:Putative hydro-lyase DKW60_14375 n=1 Tax=Leucothrix pacifica TaxID=1247513 RepID=A0A317CBW4_9GAMM|nr:putative hydro-lyase [Leucothrix pacifica]PWQ95601.1 putative hydro-lyase [Leucothrix pacifica]